MNVYFNSLFSATSYAIADLRARWTHGPLRVIISQAHHDPYLEEIADHFEVEPLGLESHNYVDYCLGVCRDHHVDAMVPRRHVNALIRERARFEEAGVKVMWVGDTDTYALLDDKVATLQDVAASGILPAPDTTLVSDYETFCEAYARIRDAGDDACLKPNVGVGGVGFKRIGHELDEITEAFADDPRAISWARLDRALARAGSFSPFLLSPYLVGVEYSVDCLGRSGELLTAAPRIYLNKHLQRIDERPELVAFSRQLTAHYGLSYLFNTQFRQHHGTWHLIEINTRMAAGMHRTQHAGFHLLHQAMELLMGLPITSAEAPRWGTKIFKRVAFERVS